MKWRTRQPAESQLMALANESWRMACKSSMAGVSAISMA